MELIIITGLSGAGKTLASDCFEDLGYYCIDNLPPSLIMDFVGLISQRSLHVDKAAFVVDIRSGETFDDIKDIIDGLSKRGVRHRILFLDASDKVILSRFSEARRRHPLAVGRTNEEALEEERNRLEPFRRVADYTIDTSGLNNSGLAQEIRRLFTKSGSASKFSIMVMSFGYKNSIPPDADFVFDVRFIPNPFYVASLKKLTGNSKKVSEYVMRSEVARSFLDDVQGMIVKLKPAFISEGKNTLCIAFGCTGGQHRSVTMANALAGRLTELGEDVDVNHRDI